MISQHLAYWNARNYRRLAQEWLELAWVPGSNHAFCLERSERYSALAEGNEAFLRRKEPCCESMGRSSLGCRQ